MDELCVRKMKHEDLDGVFEVEKTAFPIPWPISSFEEELKNMLATYLVAEIDKKIVGYIGLWFVMDECHVTNVAVHSEYRKQKIATKLVESMLKLCKEHATTYVTLEVRKNNLPAQSLYKKFGFAKEAVRREYYKNPDNTREDAIIMSLEL